MRPFGIVSLALAAAVSLILYFAVSGSTVQDSHHAAWENSSLLLVFLYSSFGRVCFQGQAGRGGFLLIKNISYTRCTRLMKRGLQ
jgi:hypothetical protein